MNAGEKDKSALAPDPAPRIGAPGPAPRSCGADLGVQDDGSFAVGAPHLPPPADVGPGCRDGANRPLLLVAYPLLPVSQESAGGAEQILWTLERELARRGWQTEVAACAGSQVAGRLLVTGEAPRGLDGFAEREREHTERVVEACAAGDVNRRPAMVLDHSGHFFRHVSQYAAQVRMPVLASLHLPRELYAPDAFEGLAENVYFHCVSESQRREFLDLPRMLGVVRNGIDVSRFGVGEAPVPHLPMEGRYGAPAESDGGPHMPSVGRCGEAGGDFLLWLGRICPEKAPHLAIQAAERAGMPIVLAGQVYPFAWHRDYWQREIAPRIDGKRVRWIELPSFAEKCRLLRQARGLLVTSQIAETTSLVALEAMASGTPVIAFRRGALPEVVGERTGFLVDNVEQMASACAHLGEIRADDCRAWVARKYSAAAMAESYEEMMLHLLERMEVNAGIRKGLAAIDAGESKSIGKAISEIKTRRRPPR